MGLRDRLTALPVWARWLIALLPLRCALAALIPVLPEEAYHWNFARHLDWGYYDHPPMIAWAIAAGRAVFGDTAIGIRAVPLLFSIGTSILLARLAERFYGGVAAVWAVILFTFGPVALPVSEAGFPDSPMLFFWSLTMTLAWRAITGTGGAAWLAAGVALGLALLSKYTAVMIVPGILLYLVLSKEHRRWLATPWPYLAGAAALAVFSPVIYWNWTHEWASFLFQSRGRFQESRGFRPGTAFQFLWVQALAVFPLTLPLAVVTSVRLFRTARPEERYFRACLLPIVLVFFGVSWFRSVHVLWPLPGYLGLLVVMAGVVVEGTGKVAAAYGRFRNGLLGVSCLALVVGGAHLAFFLPWLSPIQGPYGWNEVAVRARELRSTLPESAFYLAHGRKYTCASQLAYQLNLPNDVHGSHLIGYPALQYGYWCDPRSMVGRDAVVVAQDRDRAAGALAAMKIHFESAEPAGELRIPLGRSPLIAGDPLVFYFFLGRRYRLEKNPG